MPALTFRASANFALANFLASLVRKRFPATVGRRRFASGRSNETYQVPRDLLDMRPSRGARSSANDPMLFGCLPQRASCAVVGHRELASSYPRQHRRAAFRRDQDQDLHRRFHSGASCTAFGSFVMPASSSVTSSRPRGSGIGSSKRRCHPFSGISANLLSADPVERRRRAVRGRVSPERRTEVNLTDQGYCAHRTCGKQKASASINRGS